MNYGDFRKGVLKLIDEYSSRGTELAASKTADLKIRTATATNEVLLDLARETSLLAAVFYIVQNPIDNEYSYDTSALKRHVPNSTTDIIELAGAQAYFYECQGPATVNVQEEIAGVWTSLSTDILGSTITWLAEYKGNTGIGSTANNCRLYFQGSYIFNYRNEKLYPYAFSTDSDVQQHRPHFLYSLPSNFLFLENVYRRINDNWTKYSPYYLLDGESKIGISRYDTGEYAMNYFRSPTEIVYSGVDVTDDAQALDCNSDAVYVAMLGVAALLQVTENPTLSVMFSNQYEVGKASLKKPDRYYPEFIQNVTGW
ncbi:MAG: hypothetical protein WC364_10970 [Eubacteriales bacterium]|jgi:hypothetical protein